MNLVQSVISRHYLRQGGYVIVEVLSVCLSVCLMSVIVPFRRKNSRTDLHEIFREGWQWAIEQTIKFWWRQIRIRIATLVRRALAEVCTAPLLIVLCATKGFV